MGLEYPGNTAGTDLSSAVDQAKMDTDLAFKREIEDTSTDDLIDRLLTFVEHLPAEIAAEYHAKLTAIKERW